MLHLKAYLIKVDCNTCWFDVIEIPCQMSKRKRAWFERMRKARFSDYVFAVGYNGTDVAGRMLGVELRETKRRGKA
jgi:hypothetical protein